MIRRLIRQAGVFTVASFGWKHRGTIIRGVDLLRRAPSLVSTGRTDDLATEAKAVAALDGPLGDSTHVRITGIDDGAVMLRDTVVGPPLETARKTLSSVQNIVDVRTEATDHPTFDDALAATGG